MLIQSCLVFVLYISSDLFDLKKKNYNHSFATFTNNS